MMCVSLFAGCGNQPAEETTAPKVENNETKAPEVQTEAPAEFSYPTTGSITFWTYPNGNVTANYPTFEATPAAGYAEDATGIKVDYIDDHSNNEEAFQLMISGDKLPDLIGHNWLTYSGGTTGAYEDGLCIRLNEVIDQYMPNFKAFLEARPDVKKMISDDEGSIYFVPQVGADSSLYTFGSYVRADMLAELGEEIPTTIDSWHDLFVKVKDTLGITPYSIHNGWLLNMSFISYAYGVGDTDYIVDDNGKAVYNRTSDHYKEFLMTLNQWYNEGLIDADIATISTNDVMAKVINGELFAGSDAVASLVEKHKKTIQKLFKENHVDNKELSEALEMPIQSVWRKTRLGLWTVAEMEQIAEMKNSKLQIDFISNEMGGMTSYNQLLYTINSQQRTIKMLMEDIEELKKMLP